MRVIFLIPTDQEARLKHPTLLPITNTNGVIQRLFSPLPIESMKAKTPKKEETITTLQTEADMKIIKLLANGK